MTAFLQARLGRMPGERKPENSAGRIEEVCAISSDPMARRVFQEYGAVFAVRETAVIPDKCVFNDSADVERFQHSVKTKSAVIGGAVIELQQAAMESLIEVAKDAEALDLTLTPIDGSIAGKRSYTDTVGIWNSRFQRALDHWVGLGNITAAEAAEVRNMSTQKQVERVMQWEASGLFFSTGFSRSIFSSTAPPGTSQHLSMLAIDILEHDNPAIAALLASRGWYRTILSDPNHFTYIGFPESELPNRGLRRITSGRYVFWVPNTAGAAPTVAAPPSGPGE
jgi:hypothetical protein